MESLGLWTVISIIPLSPSSSANLKAVLLIVSTDAGISIFVRSLQKEKASSSMETRFDDRVTDESAKQ